MSTLNHIDFTTMYKQYVLLMRPHLMPPTQVAIDYLKSPEHAASALLTTGCFKCIILTYYTLHMIMIIQILKHSIESTETHEAHTTPAWQTSAI